MTNNKSEHSGERIGFRQTAKGETQTWNEETQQFEGVNIPPGWESVINVKPVDYPIGELNINGKIVPVYSDSYSRGFSAGVEYFHDKNQDTKSPFEPNTEACDRWNQGYTDGYASEEKNYYDTKE